MLQTFLEDKTADSIWDIIIRTIQKSDLGHDLYHLI